MRKSVPIAGLVAAGFMAAAPFSAAHAEGKSLTMCWAAWDPANALVELVARTERAVLDLLRR